MTPVRRRSEKVTLRFIEERVTTQRAYLLVMESGEEVWVPISQIIVDWEKGTVTMPRWLAEEKQLLPPEDEAPPKPRLQ